jgi:hypothetical protein
MQLEDYFIFLASNDIRLKDTRIGIETGDRHYWCKEVFEVLF